MSFYASQSLRRGSSEMLPHRKWPGNILPFFPLIKLQQSLITIGMKAMKYSATPSNMILKAVNTIFQLFHFSMNPNFGLFLRYGKDWGVGSFYTVEIYSRWQQHWMGDVSRKLLGSHMITNCPVLHCNFNQQLFNFTNLRASIVLSPFGKCSSRAKTTQFAMIVNKTAYSKGGHSIINFV